MDHSFGMVKIFGRSTFNDKLIIFFLEVKLQSTYFDVFLYEIIADQDKQVALRWTNDSVECALSDVHPDATISTLVQHEFGHPLGFGETKAGNTSTSKRSVNIDIFKLGIVYKRAIELHGLPGCLAFMINVYSISFFIVSKRHNHFFTMTEIASLDFASSLSTLHNFASRKNLDFLASVSRCFWSICSKHESTSIDQEGRDDIVPIFEYMSLIVKPCNETLDQSSR